MYCTQPAQNLNDKKALWHWPTCDVAESPSVEYASPKRHETLAIALQLLDAGHVVRADELLTAATLEDPSDPELWLATGICRLRRGCVRAASAAFEMAAWLSDDEEARDLHDLCQFVTL